MTIPAEQTQQDVDAFEVAGRRRLLSVPDAATYLGVSAHWVYDQIRKGRLPAMYMARAWRIRPDALDEFADSFIAKPASADVRRRGQVRAIQHKR